MGCTNYLIVGSSDRFFATVAPGLFLPTVVIIKINEHGDTLRVSMLHIPTSQSNPIPYLGYKSNGVYQLVVNYPIGVGHQSSVRFPCVIEIDTNGTELSRTILSDYQNYNVRYAERTPDNGLLLAGSYEGGLTEPTNMMSIKVNFLNEVEWGNQYWPPVLIGGRGYRVEPMTNGNYLLSGFVGRRIYGYEISPAGAVVQQKIYYETPSNRIFDEAFVSQAWQNKYFSFGDFRFSNPRGLVMHLQDSLGNRIWGGETLGGNVGFTAINKEHSIFMRVFDGSHAYLKRLSQDSTEIWSINLGQGGGTFPIKRIADVYFQNNDTGIVVGTFLPNSSSAGTGEEFYMAKIAGVGTLYDPMQPWDTLVNTKEILIRPKDTPLLYPNPATEVLRFKSLTLSTEVSIYSTIGKVLHKQTILPDESVDIHTLPPGTYLYHLRMGERVFTGKFIKE